MAQARLIFRNVSKFITPKISTLGNRNSSLIAPVNFNVVPNRGLRKSFAKVMSVFGHRRKLVGREKLRPRSEWYDWNYKSELYAFAKRLNEELTEDTLRIAFTHKSFIDEEELRRKNLGISLQDVQIELADNSSLITIGEQIISKYIKAFIRHCYEALPEEGVSAVHDYLMSDCVLSRVSLNIGTKDLMLCSDFPPEESTLAATLKAIIGAIAQDNDTKRAEKFVLDFILTELAGKDIFDIWEIPQPCAVLNSFLKKQGRLPSESRLVFSSGRNTILAVFQVALFSNKEFLGQGPGETLTIAEEMAAYDALRRLFQVKLNHQALPFGAKRCEVNADFSSENAFLCDWNDNGYKTKNLLE